MSRLARAALAALLGVAGLSVGGCFGSTAYGRIGVDDNVYGYSDSPIEGGYSIRVVMPFHVKDPRLAYTYWDRRALEVCNGAVARKQIHTAQQLVIPEYNRMNGIVGDYVLEGFAWCGPAADPGSAPVGSEPSPLDSPS